MNTLRFANPDAGCKWLADRAHWQNLRELGLITIPRPKPPMAVCHCAWCGERLWTMRDSSGTLCARHQKPDMIGGEVDDSHDELVGDLYREQQHEMQDHEDNRDRETFA